MIPRVRCSILLAAGCVLTLPSSAPLAAVQSPPGAVVDELPGAGRAIETEMTRSRREALARRLGPGLLAVPAAGARDLEDEVLQDNDFRQDDYFFYLTGLEAPDAWLLIATQPSGARESHLFLPARNPRQEAWTGKKLGPGPDAARLTGITRVHPLDSLDRVMGSLRRQTPGPLYTVMYSGTADNARIRAWTESSTGIDVRNAVPVLDSLRLVKAPDELTRLRRAIDITADAHRAAMRRVRVGMFEYQIEAIVEYTFRSLGADRVGFPSIVGSGPNSTTLHYDVNRRQTEPGDLVVIDIGAEYGQYSADVTRTIPIDGRYTDRQRAIYNLVLGAQQAAIDATRPGVTIGELSGIARQYIESHSGDLCGSQSCNRYFIHGLSHWLGMRVHDVGDYSTPLAPGMVITVEPGIYIPGEQLGVRIEDDILVTRTGAEVLSGNAPRAAEDIETLMSNPIP